MSKKKDVPPVRVLQMGLTSPEAPTGFLEDRCPGDPAEEMTHTLRLRETWKLADGRTLEFGWCGKCRHMWLFERSAK